jgi:hypothetical protein
MSNVSNIGSPDLAHLLEKTRDAARSGPAGMSAGEQLAVALILDRPDWLAAGNSTMAEAMEQVGPDWLRLIPAVARQFRREHDETAYAVAEKARQAKLAQFVARQDADEEIDFSATLVTYGDAPGYRDVRFTFDFEPVGEVPTPTIRAHVRIRAADGERIVGHITDVHRFAWNRSGGRPIDASPDEQRPAWIDRK